MELSFGKDLGAAGGSKYSVTFSLEVGIWVQLLFVS